MFETKVMNFNTCHRMNECDLEVRLCFREQATDKVSHKLNCNFTLNLVTLLRWLQRLLQSSIVYFHVLNEYGILK